MKDKYLISFEGRMVSMIEADKLSVNNTGQTILCDGNKILAVVPSDHAIIKKAQND